MNYLSPKKQNFVDFIRDFTHENNRPPTFVEIMSGLNIRSLGTINWYVNELEKEDVIRRMKGKNGKRALSVLEQNTKNNNAKTKYKWLSKTGSRNCKKGARIQKRAYS